MNAQAQSVVADAAQVVTRDEIDRMKGLLDKLSSVVPDAAKEAAGGVTATVTRRAPRPRKGATMNQTLQPAPQAQALSNAPTFETLLATAVELGTEAGKGSDTQVRFDLKVLETSFVGTVDLSAGKHGTDVDDATKLGETYAKARNSSIVFNAKAPNQRKLISDIRTMIKLGMYSKGGTGEPLSTVNTLMTLWQKKRRDPALGKKMNDAHNTLMRFARAQLKRDTMIDTAELDEYCVRRETEPRSGEEVLEAIRKMANNLKIGKVANCPDLDNSPEVQAIITNCNKRITAIAKAKRPAQAA